MNTVLQSDNQPLLTIGLPVYNGEHSIMNTIDSLLSQSFSDFELIIVDNASTDQTRTICGEYVTTDSRVTVISSPENVGITENFNRAAKMGSGQYFMWAAADDVFSPEYIQTCIDVLTQDQQIVLAGTATAQIYQSVEHRLFVDSGFSLMQTSASERFKTYRNILIQPRHIGMIFYGIYQRSVLNQVLPSLNVIGSDHLLIGSIALKGKIKTVSAVYAHKKTGGISASFDKIAKALGCQYSPEFPFFQREKNFQRVIADTQLKWLDKIQLRLWSAFHFLWHNVCLETKLGKKFRFLKQFSFRDIRLILHYKRHGRKPWGLGYTYYKDYFLEREINNPLTHIRFLNHEQLPDQFGFRLDERVVEYPWVFSRINYQQQMVLDAGSALNFPYLLESPALKTQKVVICTLAPEINHYKSNRVSYVYDDLRQLMFKDQLFDTIVSISTIEHVGMDNTKLYTQDGDFNEACNSDYLQVISELKRLLKPGGKLLITVPFGKKQKFDWLQQFDLNMVNTVINRFDGSSHHVDYFRYQNDGWQWTTADACVADEYYDIHSATGYTDDLLAASRAIACIELVL